jgi:hypothetical protein
MLEVLTSLPGLTKKLCRHLLEVNTDLPGPNIRLSWLHSTFPQNLLFDFSHYSKAICKYKIVDIYIIINI